MLIGEAPGKVEDQQGKAFVGPAGELQDKIFAAAGISTEEDMYLGNICKCRPTAKKGSGKQNDTPEKDQTFYCKPYILKEIELINPEIVVAVGKTAAVTLYGFESKTLMKHIVGRFFNSEIQALKGRELFTIYHPAAILHATGDREAQLKRDIWEQVKKIRKKVDELGIQLKGV
jgi:DNA polymerase